MSTVWTIKLNLDRTEQHTCLESSEIFYKEIIRLKNVLQRSDLLRFNICDAMTSGMKLLFLSVSCMHACIYLNYLQPVLLFLLLNNSLECYWFLHFEPHKTNTPSLSVRRAVSSR